MSFADTIYNEVTKDPYSSLRANQFLDLCSEKKLREAITSEVHERIRGFFVQKAYEHGLTNSRNRDKISDAALAKEHPAYKVYCDFLGVLENDFTPAPSAPEKTPAEPYSAAQGNDNLYNKMSVLMAKFENTNGQGVTATDFYRLVVEIQNKWEAITAVQTPERVAIATPSIPSPNNPENNLDKLISEIHSKIETEDAPDDIPTITVLKKAGCPRCEKYIKALQAKAEETGGFKVEVLDYKNLIECFANRAAIMAEIAMNDGNVPIIQIPVPKPDGKWLGVTSEADKKEILNYYGIDDPEMTRAMDCSNGSCTISLNPAPRPAPKRHCENGSCSVSFGEFNSDLDALAPINDPDAPAQPLPGIDPSGRGSER